MTLDGPERDLADRQTDCPYIGSLTAPTYSLLASLPTDPHVLLSLMNDEANRQGRDADSETFRIVGSLLGESVLPPGVGAAVYHAATLIPGVQERDDATNATGEHGIVLTRDNAYGENIEYIFDRANLEMIGKRRTLTTDAPTGKAGDVMELTAIQVRAIVGAIGETR